MSSHNRATTSDIRKATVRHLKTLWVGFKNMLVPLAVAILWLIGAVAVRHYEVTISRDFFTTFCALIAGMMGVVLAILIAAIAYITQIALESSHASRARIDEQSRLLQTWINHNRSLFPNAHEIAWPLTTHSKYLGVWNFLLTELENIKRRVGILKNQPKESEHGENNQLDGVNEQRVIDLETLASLQKQLEALASLGKQFLVRPLPWVGAQAASLSLEVVSPLKHVAISAAIILAATLLAMFLSEARVFDKELMCDAARAQWAVILTGALMFNVSILFIILNLHAKIIKKFQIYVEEEVDTLTSSKQSNVD